MARTVWTERISRRLSVKESTQTASPFDLDLDHKYLVYRRTKIVASIGPASDSPAMLRKLILQGMNVARINFSHGDPGHHLEVMRRIRSVAAGLGKTVAIMGDLCGPKIRVGMFAGDAVTLKDKTRVWITTRQVMGTAELIPSQYPGIVSEVRVGDPILLDDGNLELRVLRKSGDKIEAYVLRGGVLKNKKGMNLPETKLNISALTAKDKSDALYCIKGGVDYIALSFVRQPSDILDLRRHLKRHNADIPIIAKIEKPEALRNINGIMELVDGIMVARGDLGVELPTKKVPQIQNGLIQLANYHDKPVIVATQMLESMMEHSRPTRAEVSDVAGACMACADAVMLSGETAAGKYPAESVGTMDAILRETEAYQFFSKGGLFRRHTSPTTSTLLDAVGAATAQISRDLMARTIFVLTRSGATARIISSDRPAAPMFALTQSENVARRMNLLWGVYPFLVKKNLSMEEYLKQGERIIKKLNLAKSGDYIIMLSGLTSGNPTTNSLVVHRVS
ncbi:MAG: pyruvate kinase [Verrucomicrobia bacterium]|nr:pyruvate kinase [Verrucomicrobiota bacterium]